MLALTGTMRRLALLGIVVVAACVTPSIPIPPPDPAKMTFAVDTTNGLATFAYAPTDIYIGAVAFVYNRDKGVGVIENAHDDGSVGPTAPVAAVIGDQIVVTFQREDQSVSTCIRLRDGAQDPTVSCSR
jgi:hypothetical protein